MSFTRTVAPSQMIGAVIGLLVLGYAVRFLLAGGIEEYFNPNKKYENAIVAAFEKQPGNLAVLRAMERQFPQEYDDFLGTMTKAAASGREEDILRDGSAYLQQFAAKHAGDFSNAPDALLVRVADAESRLLSSLAAGSMEDCADYVFGTLQPARPLAPETRKLLGETAAARIEAISGGRTNQTVRLGVTPTEGKALIAAMKARGANAAQLGAMRGEIDPETLSVEDRCNAGINLLEGIRAQPPEVEALLASDLLGPTRYH